MAFTRKMPGTYDASIVVVVVLALAEIVVDVLVVVVSESVEELVSVRSSSVSVTSCGGGHPKMHPAMMVFLNLAVVHRLFCHVRKTPARTPNDSNLS